MVERSLEVDQDLSDDGRVDDESEELHFSPASTTGQRIDLVDTVTSSAHRLLRARFCGGSASSCSPSCSVETARGERVQAQAIGVRVVEPDEMFVGLGYVNEHSSQEFEWVHELVVSGIMP